MRLSVATVFLWLFPFVANAALVDNGIFTTDQNSSLDWLDLKETVGMSATQAVASHAGWRLASNNEVEGLFNTIFPNYVANFSYKGTERDIATTNEGFFVTPVYAEFESEVTSWLSLIGPAFVSGDSYYGYGYYQDESGIWRQTGAFRDVSETDGVSIAVGLDHSSNYQTAALNGGSLANGIYLVRSSVVPIPAAAWLFGSALAGLGWMRRRQTADGAGH